jgi:glycosyltransferase involved in cell wall biosynthesis
VTGARARGQNGVVAATRPRVLFVSRERFRLPLEGTQKRKWDALAAVVEHRVLAAAPAGAASGDECFHLVPPARPGFLDGALFYLLLPWRISRQLIDFRPVAALVQGVHEAVAFLLARRLAGVETKLILDVQGDWQAATRLYGSPLRRLLNPVNDALAPVAVRGADAVRTISVHTTELVEGLGVEPAATFPPFVDAEAFLRRPLCPLPDRPRALFVGVLEAYKNVDGLARAWRAVASRVPQAQLHLVGDGTRTDVAEALVRDHGALWDRSLDADGVAEAMDASWLLTLPSRAEGLGRVLVEAACRGRCLVGADRGGIPDVVTDGANGLLIDADDPNALADALVRVLGDRAYAERLGVEARRTGEAWSVTPAEYAAKVERLVRGVRGD